METNRAFYLGLFLLLLAIDCSVLDFKVTVSAKTGSQDTQLIDKKDSNEQRGELSSVSDSNIVVKGNEKHQNQANGSNKKIGGDTKDTNSNSSSSSQSGSKKDDANNNNSSNELNSQSGSKKDDAENNNNSNELNSQSGSRKTDNLEEGAGDLNENKKVDDGGGDTKKNPELASKDSRFEECDPSNKCTDEKNQLVACLRVSGGNDQYSLLVRNKGESRLAVTISAPDYVHLQKTKIQLQSKEDKEVEVSFTDGGNDNLIVLRAGNLHCNLDIKHFITKNLGKELDNSQKSNYINFMSRTPTIVILAFVALVMLAAGWTCISFRRKQHSSSSKYQKLDMELPVSGGGKAESEQNDGWDDKWGDDWDDEEAPPMTPSIPVTPSLSSKGLASRRLSKEGWKD